MCCTIARASWRRATTCNSMSTGSIRASVPRRCLPSRNKVTHQAVTSCCVASVVTHGLLCNGWQLRRLTRVVLELDRCLVGFVYDPGVVFWWIALQEGMQAICEYAGSRRGQVSKAFDLVIPWLPLSSRLADLLVEQDHFLGAALRACRAADAGEQWPSSPS